MRLYFYLFAGWAIVLALLTITSAIRRSRQQRTVRQRLDELGRVDAHREAWTDRSHDPRDPS